MSHLWFVENRAQAEWIRDCPQEVASCHVVAQTAEALQALEEFGVNHVAVAEYADTRLIADQSKKFQSECFALINEVEDYILSNYDDVGKSDAGYLTTHIYWIYHAMIILATRAHLWQETIRACRPSTVSIFKSVTDENYLLQTPLLWHSSFSMDNILRQFESLYSLHFDVRSLNVLKPYSSSKLFVKPSLSYLSMLPSRAGKYLVRKSIDYSSKIAFYIDHLKSNGETLKVFLIGGVNDEWRTVISKLNKKISVYSLLWANNSFLTNERGFQGWSSIYDDSIISIKGFSSFDLDFGQYNLDERQINIIADLYDQWTSRVDSTSLLKFGNVSLTEDVLDIVRPLATYGISLSRYIDSAVSDLLDLGDPDVVCFQGVIHMADKRMVSACRKRGIPTVGIQHGGSVGTHENSKIDINDIGWCDYYLTYGDGIRNSDVSIIPKRAKLIPVGSPSIDKRLRPLVKRQPMHTKYVRVLWITDKSYGNTIGHDSRMEETSRYLLHKRCLDMLGKCPDVKLTLRPFKSTEGMLGTTRLINNDPNLDVNIDTFSRLDDLIYKHDIVITDNTASTVWNEAIVFGKPLILFCDPKQTVLMNHFVSDLERACCWCRTENEFIDAVKMLVTEGFQYVNKLSQIDTADYIKKYILHSDNCRPVDRATSFLDRLMLDQDSSVMPKDC
ncbi:MAG: hypothetical protein CL606_02545 [Anaerolineaceae bacterium]|nr:hypothetical protein [Anaerolineaceae bacterium]